MMLAVGWSFVVKFMGSDTADVGGRGPGCGSSVAGGTGS